MLITMTATVKGVLKLSPDHEDNKKGNEANKTKELYNVK